MTGRAGFAVRRLSVAPVDRAARHRIACLSPTRTLLELARARQVSDRRLRVALDDLRRRRLTSLSLLDRRAGAFERHRGASRCRALLARPDGAAESEGERRLLPLVTGLWPLPRWGVTDLVAGRRFDLAWPELRLALEYDGRAHHVLPTDRDQDGLRDLECAESGVLVLRITHGMLTEDWEGTRARVHRVFERRKAAYS